MECKCWKLFLLLLLVSKGWVGFGAEHNEKKAGVVTRAEGKEEIYRPWPIDSLGLEIVRIGRDCLALDAYFSLPSFFRKLKRVETPEGPLFRDGRHIVTEFPKELILYIDAGHGRLLDGGVA
jgi:hypothetical protein